ncbi:MAG: hypothetical protein AAF636_07990 [Pseudomonadota bacterium]
MNWAVPLGAVIAVLGGAYAYWNQKRIDRQMALIETRRSFYGDFLEALLDNMTSRRSHEDDVAQYKRLRLRLYALASDDVISAFGELNTVLSQNTGKTLSGRDYTAAIGHLADLILAMRADCFEKSNLSKETVAKILPFNDPDAVREFVEDTAKA